MSQLIKQQLDYLTPVVYDEFIDMEVIKEVASLLLDGIFTDNQLLERELFLITAKSDGLKCWEDVLTLPFNSDAESRRRAIQTKFLGQTKLNEQKVKEITRSFTGEELKDLLFRSGYLKLVFEDVPQGTSSFFDLQRTLDILLPAHLGLAFNFNMTISDFLRYTSGVLIKSHEILKHCTLSHQTLYKCSGCFIGISKFDPPWDNINYFQGADIFNGKNFMDGKFTRFDYVIISDSKGIRLYQVESKDFSFSDNLISTTTLNYPQLMNFNSYMSAKMLHDAKLNMINYSLESTQLHQSEFNSSFEERANALLSTPLTEGFHERYGEASTIYHQVDTNYCSKQNPDCLDHVFFNGIINFNGLPYKMDSRGVSKQYYLTNCDTLHLTIYKDGVQTESQMIK